MKGGAIKEICVNLNMIQITQWILNSTAIVHEKDKCVPPPPQIPPQVMVEIKDVVEVVVVEVVEVEAVVEEIEVEAAVEAVEVEAVVEEIIVGTMVETYVIFVINLAILKIDALRNKEERRFQTFVLFVVNQAIL